MIFSTTIFSSSKEYVKIETAKYQSLIHGHLIKIRKDEDMIQAFKKLDAPNIPYLINEKEKDIVRRKVSISKYKRIINSLALVPTNKRVFLKLLKTLNHYIIYEILKGGIYTFPYSIGTLSMYITNRSYTLKSINWAKTMTNVHNIAKVLEPDLYEKHKKGYIYTFEYMSIMRQHLHPTPNKPLWLVYNLSDTVWFAKFKKGVINNKEKYFFKFSGTYYILHDKKTVNDLEQLYKSVDEILNSTQIGFINKMTLLKKFFSTEVKYKYNDLSTS